MYYMYRRDNTESRTNGAQDARKIELDIKKMGIRQYCEGTTSIKETIDSKK